MKNKTVVAVLIVLLLLFAGLIYLFPFGAKPEGFQNTVKTTAQLKAARAAKKEGFQTQRVGATPMPSVPTTMPSMPMPSMPMPSMSSTTSMPPMPVSAPTMQTQPPMEPQPMAPTTATPMVNTPASTIATPQPMLTLDASGNIVPNKGTSTSQGNTFNQMREGFANVAASSNGARDAYKPIGAYDGVTLPTGNKVSAWRHTAPNEPLMGAEFTPGDDSLFMFKNNQCKPECCGASFSCSGGCVCTTPQQRDYLASRGGNRTKPEDSA